MELVFRLFAVSISTFSVTPNQTLTKKKVLSQSTRMLEQIVERSIQFEISAGTFRERPL